MPRKGYVPRRESAADPKYDSVLVTRFINAIMGGGKRSIAEGHFYKAMTMIEEKTGQEAMAVLKLAMNNVKPGLARTTRCRWRSVQTAATRSRRAGSSRSRAAARTTRSRRSSRTS